MVILAYNIDILIFGVFHFFTGWQRKAWISRKKESLIHLILLLILVLIWAIYHLSKDTANTPNVNRLIVLLFNENYFRGSVPSWNHMIWKKSFLFFSSFPLSNKLLWNLLLSHFLFNYILILVIFWKILGFWVSGRWENILWASWFIIDSVSNPWILL